MNKQLIIDLIRSKYDPAPNDWSANLVVNWDDGSADIADEITRSYDDLLRAAASFILSPAVERVRIGRAGAHKWVDRQQLKELISLSMSAPDDQSLPHQQCTCGAPSDGKWADKHTSGCPVLLPAATRGGK